MTFDYTRSRAAAERMIARFGQDATLVQNTKSGPDYAPVLTPSETTIKVIDLNQQIKDRSGTQIGETKRTLYISTSAGIAPQKGDKIRIAGLIHEIEEVRPLSPAGVDVFYEADLVT